MPLASTLPLAQSRPATAIHKSIRSGDTHLAGVLSVLEQLKGANVNWENETVVSFCDTGELGALNWFYASEVSGIRNVKLYPESARGWKASGRPLVIPETSD